jgi:hypothetical protein
MKTTKIIIGSVGLVVLATITAISGPTIVVPAPVVVAPAPVVVAPAPAVSVAIGVPDVYVSDGVEIVGVIGTQYVYLGPGDVWVVMDAPRLVRFHEWEKTHADWQVHATVNVKYRTDAHGHAVPSKGDKDKGIGNGEGHAHGGGHGH